MHIVQRYKYYLEGSIIAKINFRLDLIIAMQSLKQIKNRIKAVKEVLKVTSAMQVVSSVKLRQARSRIDDSRPYTRRMHLLLRSLNNRHCLDRACSPLLYGTGSEARHLILVFSTDRGLCGGINSNIVRVVDKAVERFLATGASQVQILCIGQKAYRLLRSRHADRIIDVISFGNGIETRFADIDEISNRLFRMFERKEFDVLCQYYTKYDGVSKQTPKTQQLIPVTFARLEINDSSGGGYAGQAICQFEPDEIEVFEELLPHYIESQIYRAMLETAASEQAARMLAMSRARDNAVKIIEAQTLNYNKMRQQRITNELIEIVAAIR